MGTILTSMCPKNGDESKPISTIGGVTSIHQLWLDGYHQLWSSPWPRSQTQEGFPCRHSWASRCPDFFTSITHEKTVDGCEILHPEKGGWNPVNNGTFAIYQLVQDFFHPQYHVVSLLWVCLKTSCTHVISCSWLFESEHDHYAMDVDVYPIFGQSHICGRKGILNDQMPIGTRGQHAKRNAHPRHTDAADPHRDVISCWKLGCALQLVSCF